MVWRQKEDMMRNVRSVAIAVLLALAALLDPGARFAGAAGVDDPLDPAAERHIRDFRNAWLGASAPGPRGEVVGWPTYSGIGWSIQYPREWTIREANEQFLWARNPSGTAAFIIANTARVPGLPSAEELRDLVYSRLLGGAPARLIASERKRIAQVPQTGDDSGAMSLYILRWQDATGELMLGAIQITILSRGQLGTDYQCFVQSCPERQWVETWKQVFDPMIVSAQFISWWW